MPARSVHLSLGAATVVLLAATACGGGGDDATPSGGAASAAGASAGTAPRTVAVARLAYDPVELTIPAGTTVTWRSDEPITHTVTSGKATGIDATSGLRSGQQPDGKFDGPLDAKGSTFAFRFTDPGTYAYYCAIHQGMNASVVVN
ncbi:MAG TPA: plastocyanin/azurin family copper-binding protein [Frankiaceae bacterium]|nr:plastocyanin/azurin family copper-binding protein [Frankiaceae bacterium]